MSTTDRLTDHEYFKKKEINKSAVEEKKYLPSNTHSYNHSK